MGVIAGSAGRVHTKGGGLLSSRRGRPPAVGTAAVVGVEFAAGHPKAMPARALAVHTQAAEEAVRRMARCRQLSGSRPGGLGENPREVLHAVPNRKPGASAGARAKDASMHDKH